MAEILVLQAQIRENFSAVHNVTSVHFFVACVPNTTPEVWSAKIGHFHGYGQAVTYLEAHGDTLVQAYRNLLQMTVDMVVQSRNQGTKA
ncbi:hypothetical protein KCV07_g7473, partial [Aureobasidium melanogenum]